MFCLLHFINEWKALVQWLSVFAGEKGGMGSSPSAPFCSFSLHFLSFCLFVFFWAHAVWAQPFFFSSPPVLSLTPTSLVFILFIYLFRFAYQFILFLKILKSENTKNTLCKLKYFKKDKKILVILLGLIKCLI